jgi:thiopurine S-methyltransferase
LKDVNPIIEKYGPKYLLVANRDTSTATSDDTDADAAEENENVESCDAKNPIDNDNKRVKRSKRVFVPLCGKTVDLAYLTTLADEVVGVEGIRMALEQFAKEQPQLNISTESTTTTTDGFERFQGDKITLLKGDFFELDATKTDGKFDLIFDRASMVAIEPKLRQAYVDVLGSLLAEGGTILLVVLERKGTEEGMKMGPPFSVSEAAVREQYEDKDWVETVKLLEQSDQLETKPEDRERFPDLDHLYETVYEIKRKA